MPRLIRILAFMLGLIMSGAAFAGAPGDGYLEEPEKTDSDADQVETGPIQSISPPTKEVSADVGNHYLRLGIFASRYRNSSFRNDDEELGPVKFGKNFLGLQVGYGYRINQFFRLEGNLEHQGSIRVKGYPAASLGHENGTFSSKVAVSTAMLWGIADTPAISIPVAGDFKFFGGGGVGVSYASLGKSTLNSSQLTAIMPGGERYNTALGGTIGISRQISERVTIDLGYRYMDYGKVRQGRNPVRITHKNSYNGSPPPTTASSLIEPAPPPPPPPGVPTNTETRLRGNTVMLALRFAL